jgi:hypothetical protein
MSKRGTIKTKDFIETVYSLSPKTLFQAYNMLGDTDYICRLDAEEKIGNITYNVDIYACKNGYIGLFGACGLVPRTPDKQVTALEYTKQKNKFVSKK